MANTAGFYFEFGEFDNSLTLFDDNTSEPLRRIDCGSEYMQDGLYAADQRERLFELYVKEGWQKFVTFQCGSCERCFYVLWEGKATECHFCGSGNFCEGYIDDEEE